MLLPYPPFEILTHSSLLADIDFETYSAAGYVWVPPDPPGEWKWKKPTKKKPGEWVWKSHEGWWEAPPGVTSSKKGIKAVGAYNYVTHPSFEILRLAYNLKDGAGKRRWYPANGSPSGLADPRPVDLIDHVHAGKTIEAWNSFFEWCSWNLYCVHAFDWPPLKLEQLRCAMSKARNSAYPGKLERCGEVLQLPPHLMKDIRGEKLVKKLTVPRAPTKGNQDIRWTPFTAAADFQQFAEYNDQDIVTEEACSSRIPDLSPRELEIWRFDQRRNFRGMRLSRVDVDNCICIIEQGYEKYNSELFILTNGAVKSASEQAKMLRWMATYGVHLEELDEEAIELALQQDYPPAVMRALKIRQILAYGSVRKLYAMRAQMSPIDDRIRDQYIFAGAHTKLWNGQFVQPANLYKGQFDKPEQVHKALAAIATRSLEHVESLYGDALECVADCLRSMIVAAPGNKLISADFTALQATVTACLAGEQWRIDVFNSHGKIYEAQAAMLTGKTLQYYLDYKKEHGKHHQDRQDWGKLPVLSGDFGAWIGGWKRFGADKILGADENIKAAILKLRSSIPNTVELWGGQTRNKFNKDSNGNRAEEHPQLFGLEGAAISAVLSPGQCFGYRGVAYQMHEDSLYCRPPSGGFMRYHNPSLRPSNRTYASPWELELTYYGWNTNATKGKGGWEPMKLYGGVCTQNAVANISREIQCDALLALDQHEPRAYPIVMDTHDENVAEVPDRPEYSTREYTQIMVDSLGDWARFSDGSRWPIRIPEAWEGGTYGKWE